jgi:hypothetical protein
MLRTAPCTEAAEKRGIRNSHLDVSTPRADQELGSNIARPAQLVNNRSNHHCSRTPKPEAEVCHKVDDPEDRPHNSQWVLAYYSNAHGLKDSEYGAHVVASMLQPVGKLRPAQNSTHSSSSSRQVSCYIHASEVGWKQWNIV